MTTAAGPWVEKWLSPPRFAVYVTAAAGDRARALALYEWNTTTSAAVLHDLAHLEVALRNGYDAAIVTHTPAGLPHWTTDPYRLFPVDLHVRNRVRVDVNRVPRTKIARAVRDAGGTNASSGKVVAELTFGFWRYMTTKSHHDRLWIPFLHHAFTPGTARPEVDDPVYRLHGLRNRVAHHEPVLGENLLDRHHDVLDVAARISTELHDHIVTTSQVPTLVTARP